MKILDLLRRGQLHELVAGSSAIVLPLWMLGGFLRKSLALSSHPDSPLVLHLRLPLPAGTLPVIPCCLLNKHGLQEGVDKGRVQLHGLVNELRLGPACSSRKLHIGEGTVDLRSAERRNRSSYSVRRVERVHENECAESR